MYQWYIVGMELTETVEVDAAASQLWQVLADVERLPELTASMTSVVVLDSDPVGVGSRVRIRQPRLVPVTWTITRWEPDVGFTWEAAAAGLRSVGDHDVASTGPRTSRLTLSLVQRGPLDGVMRLFYGRLSRRYVALEAAGLKRVAERTRID
jgi:uncharacterized membrane protein